MASGEGLAARGQVLAGEGLAPVGGGGIGGLTLALQYHEPPKAEQSNWLPAPPGPFYAVLRLYLPKPEANNGQWKLPPLTPLK